MKIFLILSLLACCQMGIMYSFNGLEYLGDGKVSFFAKISMGNMGFSASICTRGIIDWARQGSQMKLMLQCQGTTQIGSVIGTGLLYDKLLVNGVDEASLLRCYMTDE